MISQWQSQYFESQYSESYQEKLISLVKKIILQSSFFNPLLWIFIQEAKSAFFAVFSTFKIPEQISTWKFEILTKNEEKTNRITSISVFPPGNSELGRVAH